MLWCKHYGYTSTKDTIFIVFTVPDLKMAMSFFESPLPRKTAQHSGNVYFSLSPDREKRPNLHKSWVTDGRKEKSVSAINNLLPADYFIVISLSAFQFETQLAQMYLFHVHHNKCTARNGRLAASKSISSETQRQFTVKEEKNNVGCVLCCVFFQYIPFPFPYFSCGMRYLGLKGCWGSRREEAAVRVRGFSDTWRPCRWDLSWPTMCAPSP